MSEPGKLLFRVKANHTENRLLYVLLSLAFATLGLAQPYLRHRPPNWGLVSLALVYLLPVFVRGRGAVCENGIRLPDARAFLRTSFIAWSQIERYHWDGDVVTIVPAFSAFSGLDHLPSGGSARVPPDRKAQLEGILAGCTAGARQAQAKS